MNEPLPLAKVHDAVLNFLRNRDDAALFGAQAVNAYVDEPRMTQDIDVLSPRAAELAEEIRSQLAREFHIAVRVRTVAGGMGFRVFQLRKPKNRHLVDVRQLDELPITQLVGDVRVLMPEDVIALKLIGLSDREGQPKADTDRRDLKVLLLKFPQLKSEMGPVLERLHAWHANERAVAAWGDLVATEIRPGDDEW